VTSCPRPLDPIDAEAVAAGAEPVFAQDAASHAAVCGFCGGLVASAKGLSDALEGLAEAPEGPGEPFGSPSGLADRVIRLRPFSPKERRTYALWQAPVLLDVTLVLSALALLALPALTATEQVSLGAAALAPVVALARSTAGWALEALRVAPAGLQALSAGFRGQSALGLAALALLVPAGLGLRRVLARVPGRR
jgi:hypothetical protein